MTVSISRKRQAKERQAKLDKLAEAIAAGSLTVRKASEQERERFQAEKEQRRAKKRRP
jgi:hypothetical protein